MTGTAPDGPHAPPFSPTVVEEMLRQLDKTMRARQLYLPNNPAFQTALQRLRASFAPIWAETSELTLTVTDSQFRWEGVVVQDHQAKASDALPWLLYKDGMRELTLTRGVEEREVEDLLDVIPRVRRAQPDEDDLLTILWELEFEYVRYKFVDLAQDGAPPLETGREPGRTEAGAGPAAPATAEGVAAEVRADAASAAEPMRERAGVVRLEDFDSTLYFLEENEIAYIREQIEREYGRDLRRKVLDALLDILEAQTDGAVRDEVLQHLDQMVLHLLAAGRFDSVAYLLREVAMLGERAVDLAPEHAERARSLSRRLSQPATLSQILQTLDELGELPAQDDLNALFAELGAESLVTVLDWLDRIRSAEVRALLEAAAGRLAASNTAELVRLISQEGGPLLVRAIRLAGAQKASAAVPAIAKALGESDRDLRIAAASALVEIGSPGAMQGLERAIADADRDVRIAAVRALGARGQRSALARIEAALRSRELRAADLTERMAFFESYGQLCGDAGVQFLDGLLNGKSGLLGRREDPEIRACAAIALGRIRTRRATEALERALAEKDPVVRNAVNRALREGTT